MSEITITLLAVIGGMFLSLFFTFLILYGLASWADKKRSEK